MGRPLQDEVHLRPAAAMEMLGLIPTVVQHPEEGARRRQVRRVPHRLIPKGWSLMNAMTMTLWDPAIFPNPGRFDPAQFEDQSAIPPFYFMPFGGGARFLPWE